MEAEITALVASLDPPLFAIFIDLCSCDFQAAVIFKTVLLFDC